VYVLGPTHAMYGFDGGEIKVTLFHFMDECVHESLYGNVVVSNANFLIEGSGQFLVAQRVQIYGVMSGVFFGTVDGFVGE
jgi:hypothetical protein